MGWFVPHWLDKHGGTIEANAIQGEVYHVIGKRSAEPFVRIPSKCSTSVIHNLGDFLSRIKIESQQQLHAITKRLKKGSIHPWC